MADGQDSPENQRSTHEPRGADSARERSSEGLERDVGGKEEAACIVDSRRRDVQIVAEAGGLSVSEVRSIELIEHVSQG